MVSRISIPPDAGRDARALALVDSVASWPRYTLKVAVGAFPAGTVFRRAVGSNGARYLVNAVACECPDYQRSERICKHIRAIVLHQEAAISAASTPRRSYETLFPKCTVCGDLADGRSDGLCWPCASQRERELRRESQRQARAQVAA